MSFAEQLGVTYNLNLHFRTMDECCQELYSLLPELNRTEIKHENFSANFYFLRNYVESGRREEVRFPNPFPSLLLLLFFLLHPSSPPNVSLLPSFLLSHPSPPSILSLLLMSPSSHPSSYLILLLLPSFLSS